MTASSPSPVLCGSTEWGSSPRGPVAVSVV